MGELLAVEGAFDITTFEPMYRVVKEHRVEHNVVSWSHIMIISLHIMMIQMGHIMTVSVG
jgi:hypothetical protein